jgi:hypothetical protein
VPSGLVGKAKAQAGLTGADLVEQNFSARHGGFELPSPTLDAHKLRRFDIRRNSWSKAVSRDGAAATGSIANKVDDAPRSRDPLDAYFGNLDNAE